ncbi:tandem-95 repeat protein [Sphaerotilus mobilis]|uniref:Putative secreted protein (Type I secretion substrate) n=1 Tax=Sphaerotilus mobilis TaxID=47994 RepID=A0A4Q7LSN0_9BURK|nr:tandem-95 repeat protein [Sphaerotilus mobilis]RZS57855.1 putative secreted protein (type I secretion substrate) [Sphaerotilus mobilis]
MAEQTETQVTPNAAIPAIVPVAPIEPAAEVAVPAAAVPETIASLKDVQLIPDYMPARLPAGIVLGITGEVVIRTPDGTLRQLKVGDEIRKGDMILTSQDGIVEMNAEGSRLARSPMGNDLLIDPPSAGPSDPGSLGPGLRIGRLNEAVAGQSWDIEGVGEDQRGIGDLRTDEDVSADVNAGVRTVVPALNITNGTADEGDGTLPFTVTLTQPADRPLVVTLDTGAPGDTATPIADYGVIEHSLDGVTWTEGTTVTVPVGTTEIQVRVTLVPDNIHEPDETLTLIGTITDPVTDLPGGGGSGIGTIVNDDPVPTVVTVTPRNPDSEGADNIADVLEGTATANTVTYDVVLRNPSSTPTPFAVSLAGRASGNTLAADPASDLAEMTVTYPGGTPIPVTGGSITVPAGVTEFVIEILTRPDAVDETHETFALTVGGVEQLVTILDDDSSPVVSTTTVQAQEEGPNVNLGLAAPTDADAGSTLTITVTGLPTIGTVLLADGTPVGNNTVLTAEQLAGLQYRPPLDHVAGTPAGSFSYSVSDGVNVTPGQATINLAAINDRPVANDDSLPATEDTVATFTVAQLLGNDTDVDNLPADLRVVSVSSGTGGTATLNTADGTVTFTPNANFNGAATFTYTISDGSLVSPPATATVNVASVNDLPVITLPSTGSAGLTTREDEARVFSSATGNALTVSDADGPDTILSVTVNVSQGSFTLGATPLGELTEVTGDGSTSVRMTGTAAAINAALEGSSFLNNPDQYSHVVSGGLLVAAPGQPTPTLSLSVNDGITTVNSPTSNLVVQSLADIVSATRLTDKNQAFSVNLTSGFEDPSALITSIDGQAIAIGQSIVLSNGQGTVRLDDAQNITYTPTTDFISPVVSNVLIPGQFIFTVQAGGSTESTLYNVQVADTPNAGILSAVAPVAETLTGLAGQTDVFAWTLAEAGTETAPKTWQVQGYDVAPASQNGDVLDLRDLLVGASNDNIGSYLDFSRIGGDTVLTVNNDGQGAANLSITLQGVDLNAALGLGADATDVQIVASMVAQGKLLADITST